MELEEKRGAGSASCPAARGSGSRVACALVGPARAAVPRRADHRARSAVAPAALGPAAAVPRRGRHDPAHHALHGRGGGAVRPRRRRGSRQGHRAGHAARADRARSAPSTWSSSRWPTAPAARPAELLTRAARRARACGRTTATWSARRLAKCTWRCRRCSRRSAAGGAALSHLTTHTRHARGRLRVAHRQAPAR